MKFEQGQTVYTTNGYEAQYVSPIGDRHCIRTVNDLDSDTCLDDPTIVDSVYASPPVERQHAKIKELESEIDKLKVLRDELKQEINLASADEKERMARLKRNAAQAKAEQEKRDAILEAERAKIEAERAEIEAEKLAIEVKAQASRDQKRIEDEKRDIETISQAQLELASVKENDGLEQFQNKWLGSGGQQMGTVRERISAAFMERKSDLFKAEREKAEAVQLAIAKQEAEMAEKSRRQAAAKLAEEESERKRMESKKARAVIVKEIADSIAAAIPFKEAAYICVELAEAMLDGRIARVTVDTRKAVESW